MIYEILTRFLPNVLINLDIFHNFGFKANLQILTFIHIDIDFW